MYDWFRESSTSKSSDASGSIRISSSRCELSNISVRYTSNQVLYIEMRNSFYWVFWRYGYGILYSDRWSENRCMAIYESTDSIVLLGIRETKPDRFGFFLVFIFIFLTISYMNLLQVFFIISGIIIFLVAYDIAKRERFNALHFLVFLGVGSGLLIFTFVPQVLDYIGKIFGIARGADVLVYVSIIFLFYFVLLLLRKIENTREEVTRLVREIAIQNAKK